jgi:hypothetical protein
MLERRATNLLILRPFASCCKAIHAITDLYKELREVHKFEGFVMSADTEKLTLDYFKCIVVGCDNQYQ